jgi:hypothetical protein
MNHCMTGKLRGYHRMAATGILVAACLTLSGRSVWGHEVRDLKYGAVLFEFHQQKYFETLVEYDYAAERGGIDNHGDYPELLKGGVSLSYGLDNQAKDIFSRLIEENSPQAVRNRAWFYLAKMLYLRGDIERSASTLGNIDGALPGDIDQEYRYLAALVNIRLGYSDAAEAISHSFEKDGPYAPYLYFNLGVAFGREKDTERAVSNLKKAASYADGSSQLDRLADRSHMAIAYLSAQDREFAGAYDHIRQVNTTGVYSNRALLGAGWASINEESYAGALAPLTLLQRRSMALPEVQEAVLLVPHIYEKQKLMGRAAEGFIEAYDRYSDALLSLERARESLGDANVLELFVRNMDEMLAESDWFGTAPSVSLNSLSPFLLDLISDHSFQSVMKDLRDLYAIRNNLNDWKRKREDFDVILGSRSHAMGSRHRNRDMAALAGKQESARNSLEALQVRIGELDEEERVRVQWVLDDIRSDTDRAGLLVQLLDDEANIFRDTGDYAQLVNSNMEVLDAELEKTNALISRVEAVMVELINAELDVHEQRIKYYRVQAHLAKARILDRSLAVLDDQPYPEDGAVAPGQAAPVPAATDISNERSAADAP